jgi:hypothetical protein
VFLGTHLGATGLTIESTGFEASDGWNLGFICDTATFTNCLGPPLPLPGACDGDPLVDGNCCADDPNPYTGWYLSNTSQHCREPHIDTVNPATGEQHIRFVNDPGGGDPLGCVGTNTACRITAFTPTVGDQFAQPTTISYNIAMGAVPGQLPYGSNLTMWFLSTDTGGADTHYFNYYGFGYFYDYGFQSYYNMGYGYMTGTGGYDSVVEVRDPCAGTACYTLNGDTTCQSAGMAGMANWISRLIVVHDNNIYPWDIDDYSIVRGDPCPTFCDGVELEPGEECDPPADDSNCPGQCYPAGHEMECMCDRLGEDCSEATVAVNGANGPYLTHGGFFKYTADSTYTGIHTCDYAQDAELWWGFDQDCQLFDYTNDECVGTEPDTDPTAPCYDEAGPYTASGQSCLNIPTTPGETYYFVVGFYNDVIPPPLGSEIGFTITKKTGPGEPIPNGACCDGETGICSDDVPVEQCACEQCSWTENKLCSMVTCERHTGACCDAAPGLGGACVDGVYPEDCAGDQQTYYKGETCDAITCEEAVGGCCDGLTGVCTDGVLAAACVCQQCTWSKGMSCSAMQCVAAQGACCDSDDGSCTSTTMAQCNCEKCVWTKGAACGEVECRANFTPIPTVSEWGLAILALLLLTGAKIYFGRRQAATA